MKYADRYPNLRVEDPPINGIARTPEYGTCYICREFNDFACIYFEASLCSEECEQKMAEQFDESIPE